LQQAKGRFVANNTKLLNVDHSWSGLFVYTSSIPECIPYNVYHIMYTSSIPVVYICNHMYILYIPYHTPNCKTRNCPCARQISGLGSGSGCQLTTRWDFHQNQPLWAVDSQLVSIMFPSCFHHVSSRESQAECVLSGSGSSGAH
jgi:hypothetical protein